MEPHLSGLGIGAGKRGAAAFKVFGDARVSRFIRQALAAAVVLLGMTPAAGAQRAPKEPAFEEPHGADLNQGKPPAEIFKSDCAVCHKSPQGLGKGGGISLTRFLRQHYTTGEPMAAALADYLSGGAGAGSRTPVTPARAAPDRPEKPAAAPTRRAAEPADDDGLTATPNEKKRPQTEQANRPPERPRRGAKPEPRIEEASKPADTKPAEVKPAESKPAEAKPAENKPAEAKPAPHRRAAPTEEARKPAAAEKPAAPTHTAEPSPAAVAPPAEQKPAAPPPPQIPL